MSVAALAYSNAEYLRRWSEIEALSRALEGPSLEDQVVECELEEDGFIVRMLSELAAESSEDDWAQLLFTPEYFLRPKQLAVFRSCALVILFIAGRRSGKTLTAAEWVWRRIQSGAREVQFVGPNYDDIEAFMVGGKKPRIGGVQGGSGLLDVVPPWVRYTFNKDARIIEFPDYGCVVRLHSAEVAEFRGYGPDTVWGDELIKWRYAEKLITNLRTACSSVGKIDPQNMFTTSPKRQKILRDLVMDPTVETFTGAWSENLGNVHVGAYEAMRSQFTAKDGTLTRQGEEEMGGRLGVDEAGDLFPLGVIEGNRVEVLPELARTIVSVDPAGGKKRTSDEVGLVAMGRAGDINTGHGYVMEDKTKKYNPEEWGDMAFVLAEKWGASMFVLETDRFGSYIPSTIRTSGARRGYSVRPQVGTKTLIELVHDRVGLTFDDRPLKPTMRVIRVVGVSRSGRGDKSTQAEPVSTLYKNGRMHHLGALPEADAELSDFDPDSGLSPGRLDAIVNGAVHLFELDRQPEVDGAVAMKGLAEANARVDASAPSAARAWVSLGDDRRRTI